MTGRLSDVDVVERREGLPLARPAQRVSANHLAQITRIALSDASEPSKAEAQQLLLMSCSLSMRESRSEETTLLTVGSEGSEGCWTRELVLDSSARCWLHTHLVRALKHPICVLELSRMHFKSISSLKQLV